MSRDTDVNVSDILITIIGTVINLHTGATPTARTLTAGQGWAKLTGNRFLNGMCSIIFIVIISTERGHHE